MKQFFKASTLYILTISLATSCQAQKPDPAMESISYALGILFAKNLQDQGMSEISSDEMSKGLAEQMSGNATLTPEQANAMVGEFFQAKKEAIGAAYRTECEDFLTENAKNEDVEVTASGLQYTHLTEGSGDAPTAESTVTVHYRGTLLDGTEFDSSYNRGEPISFPLSGVIKDWTEGLQLMKPGERPNSSYRKNWHMEPTPTPTAPFLLSRHSSLKWN